jgi:hypothetical protein
MKGQPGLNLLTMVNIRIIEYKRDATNGRWELPLQLSEEGNELFLRLA